MRTILIVEDEKKTLSSLKYWIEQAELEVQVLTEITFDGGRDLINHTHIDLLVLDISLTEKEDELGVALAEEYREQYPYNPIIFQTVNDDYKYQSDIHKRIGSVYYLLKTELTQETFIHALKYELDRLNKPFTKIIRIKQKDQLVRINASYVIYFEKITGERNVQCFYYDPESCQVKVVLLSNITLKEIEKLPNIEHLLRCSGSHIVNPKMIESATIKSHGMELVLKYIDGRIPLSRTYHKKYQHQLERILK